jgi:23S rRNA (cytidine1920-2'-O)/16S rRNA (cytidine1409-2'-O)-methyltransferase
MVQRWQGLSTSAWQQASSNAWLHQLPQHQLQHVVVAAQRSASAASSSSTSSSGEAAGKPAYNMKQRLDDYCLQQYPSYSKNLVQSWVAQGKVLVNDKASHSRYACLYAAAAPCLLSVQVTTVTATCSCLVCVDSPKVGPADLTRYLTFPAGGNQGRPCCAKNAAVRINAEEPKYVCRAGFKLEKALDHFHIDVTAATC